MLVSSALRQSCILGFHGGGITCLLFQYYKVVWINGMLMRFSKKSHQETLTIAQLFGKDAFTSCCSVAKEWSVLCRWRNKDSSVKNMISPYRTPAASLNVSFENLMADELNTTSPT